MMQKQVLATDIGASSGRIMAGKYDGKRISLETIHRFSNDPVTMGDTMYWDFPRLFYEIKQGLLKAKSYGGFGSIGIDTWGVDFGLLDSNGRLLGNPVHYRDNRTAGFLKKSEQMIDKKRFYEITGNQFMEINTAFQLLALHADSPGLLEQADSLLLMPDLFRYFLSGEKKSECSIASTTQLFDMREKQWSWEVIKRLNLPEKLFTPLVTWGTATGKVSHSICEELGILPANVIAVAGHDTQSAMAAIPTQEKDYIFLSCGTWSILGTELDTPIINEKSQKYNITNELGVEGKYSFLKNIIGLWLVQESRRQWIREGKNYDFARLEELASEAELLKSFIMPDAPEFVPPGDVPERIRSFCRKTGQTVPETEGEIICCINQSLAMAYRKALDEIAECTGKTYSTIYLVGGGAQSRLLCQMTADACNCTVVAGPIEATAFGNVMVQYMADHEFSNLQQARKVLAESVEPIRYEPKHADRWEEAYQWYRENF